MVIVEVLDTVYAVLGIIVLPLLLLALLVAAFLPKERRKKLLERLGRLQF